MIRARNDSGMTLVELLITIVILGVVIAPLTMSMYLGLTTAKAARQTVTDSTGAQLLTAYFPKDVQSSDSVATSGFQCGAGGQVAEFAWTDADPARAEKTVVDYVVTTSAGNDALHRVSYTSNGGTCTQTNDDVLVSQLNTVAPLTCVPSSCDVAQQVTLKLSAFSKNPGGTAPLYQKYDVTISGTRRAG